MRKECCLEGPIGHLLTLHLAGSAMDKQFVIREHSAPDIRVMATTQQEVQHQVKQARQRSRTRATDGKRMESEVLLPIDREATLADNKALEESQLKQQNSLRTG